jgi:hypothetical protein
MWGIPGAILSVPMLATTKIIYDRIRPLAPASVIFLRGEAQPIYLDLALLRAAGAVAVACRAKPDSIVQLKRA